MDDVALQTPSKDAAQNSKRLKGRCPDAICVTSDLVAPREMSDSKIRQTFVRHTFLTAFPVPSDRSTILLDTARPVVTPHFGHPANAALVGRARTAGPRLAPTLIMGGALAADITMVS